MAHAEPAAVRPRRSALYMPGSNARALEKGRGLDADVLIFDLEDAVAPQAKAVARDLVAAALAAGGYGGRECVVRINALGTTWFEADLAMVATVAPDAVLLPKVEAPDALDPVTAALRGQAGPAAAPPPLWCMIETPLGVLRVAEIAALPAVTALVLGTTDLTKDLRARDVAGRAPLLPSLGLVVLAARAHGCAVLDGVHLDLDDDAGFAAACRQGRDFGFDGKTLIHPKTIETANAVFAPSEAEVAEAHRIIVAQEEAAAQGLGVAVLDGRLVEALHVEEAQRTIALADAIAGPSLT